MITFACFAAGNAPVTLERISEGGIQPQIATGADGARHLIYFKGEPGAGDVFYVRGNARPIRVNSQPGSAIATGSIRGAQIAIGRSGRVHVAWNGSRTAAPRAPDGSAPMLYARLNDAGTAFEPQRNLLHAGGALDGGGTIAADVQGHVWVVWQGKGAEPGEEHRRVYIARSDDDGKSFDDGSPVAIREETGACACCGMRALAAAPDLLYVLYRAAFHSTGRDMTLLGSTDGGKRFHAATVDPWKLNACPMTSESAIESSKGPLIAWQTGKQVFFARVDAKTGAVGPHFGPPGNGSRKFPTLAVNPRGEILLAWAEGTGWQKGGSLAWQVFDSSGNPTPEHGEASGVPVWSFPAAFAGTDGRFTIVY